MPGKYRNTLKAHAHAQASLGRALQDLATAHRDAAAAEPGSPPTDSFGQNEFLDWIARTCEIAAAADRLLALEIDLARRSGLTWDSVADVLGVSRQSAWERYATSKRRSTSRPNSRLRQAWSTKM